MANGDLNGLKILVTRPRDQALHLAQAIEQAGGVPLLFPLLKIAPVQDAEVLQEQVLRLADFDLVIFISPNAVQYGMAAIRATLSPDPASTSGSGVCFSSDLKIATVGVSSAQALRDLGVVDVLVPALRYDSEGLLELLQHVAGWRVMIFCGDGGRELLGDTLKARGATVEYATCYRRSKPDFDVGALLGAHPDAITVTSSEALEYLWQIAQTQFFDVPLFVPHARIAELARKQGWMHVYLTGAGDKGLLSGLLEWANQRTEDRGQRTEVG